LPGGQVQSSASDGQLALLHAEEAFIGALLHMPAPMASQALDLIHDEDLADYLNQRILTVVRLLVADNIAPDPVAALARARADGTVTGADATQAMAMRLADLYQSVPTPASWRAYGQAVIDEALRRQCIAMGTRVLQAAESCSLDVLIDLLDAECRTVRRLHDRRAPAIPLRAVTA
jgi:replicative DNA helicase